MKLTENARWWLRHKGWGYVYSDDGWRLVSPLKELKYRAELFFSYFKRRAIVKEVCRRLEA